MSGVPRKEAGQVVRMTLQRGYHQHQFRAIPLNYSILAKISKAMQVCLILNSYFRYSVVGDCPAAKKPSARTRKSTAVGGFIELDHFQGTPTVANYFTFTQ